MSEGALISRPVVDRNGVVFWFLRSLVTVRYTFFLTATILGLQAPSLATLAVWLLVVFLAVLLHECGHALMARYYGQSPRIELHAMGGVTSWAWTAELQWWNRVLISVAGPAAGFLLGGIVWAIGRAWPLDGPYLLLVAQYQFLWVTVAWGVFNMLPLLPMDGGQALSEYLEHRRGRDPGRRLARRISVAMGAVGCGLGLVAGQVWVALLCGLFAYDNYQRLRGEPGGPSPA